MQWEIGAGAVALLIVLAVLLWRARRRPPARPAAPQPDPARVWLTRADAPADTTPPKGATPAVTDDPSASPAGDGGDTGASTD